MPVSQRPYMGAIPYLDGCTFRVWAPFAAQVSVAGDFNNWSVDSDPLFPEGNGYWSVDVPGVGVGQQYKFAISNAGQPPLWRNDPYARSMTHASGALNSLIATYLETYPASGYSTPPWNELVIYELHIGSFVFDPASLRQRGSFTAA